MWSVALVGRHQLEAQCQAFVRVITGNRDESGRELHELSDEEDGL